MTITANKHNLHTIKPKELLKCGLDSAVLWNVDRDKEIASDIFIVATLINGYNKDILSVLKEYFGDKMILDALDKHHDRISDTLLKSVKSFLTSSFVS
jgi:hypothetical protein